MKVKEKIVISLLLLWQQLQKKGVEKIGTKNIIKFKRKIKGYTTYHQVFFIH
jgi:hypothetical protein